MPTVATSSGRNEWSAPTRSTDLLPGISAGCTRIQPVKGPVSVDTFARDFGHVLNWRQGLSLPRPQHPPRMDRPTLVRDSVPDLFLESSNAQPDTRGDPEPSPRPPYLPPPVTRRPPSHICQLTGPSQSRVSLRSGQCRGSDFFEHDRPGHLGLFEPVVVSLLPR